MNEYKKAIYVVLFHFLAVAFLHCCMEKDIFKTDIVHNISQSFWGKWNFRVKNRWA
jgi:hypothetical protein